MFAFIIPLAFTFIKSASSQCIVSIFPTRALVYENATVGTLIFNVSISGPQPQTLSLTSKTTPLPVSYLNISGIYLTAPLDYETITSYIITASANCGGTESPGTLIFLDVGNVDDMPPQWMPPGIQVYQGVISETAVPPTAVLFSVSSPLLSTIESSVERISTIIQPSNYSEYFNIYQPDSYSPSIQLIKTGLDYNNVQSILLTLTTFDYDKFSSILKFNTSIFVNVSIKDEDNHGPVFVYPSYTGSLQTNATISAVVSMLPETVRAYDGDIYINTAIGYALADTSGGTFAIDSSTGVITCRVNYPAPQVYRLAVQAYQLNNPTSRSLTMYNVLINVSSIFGNPPRCSSDPYFVTVREDTNVNTTLANIQVQTDTPLTMQYSLSTSSSPFTLRPGVNSSYALLILSETLSYIKQSSYTLQFQATTTGAITTCNILVAVSQVTKDPPVITNLATAVVTSRIKGAVVYQVKVGSSTSNTTFVFSISDFTNYFSIDASTGVITITAEPSELTQSSYSLIIKVSDAWTPSLFSQKVITITFNDTVPMSSAGAVLTIGPIIGIAVALAVVVVAAVLTIILCYLKMKRQAEIKRAPSHFGESTYSYTDRWANELPIPGEPFSEKINEMYYNDHEVQEVYQADLANSPYSFASDGFGAEIRSYTSRPPTVNTVSTNVRNDPAGSMTIFY